ncbi:MAG TPA: hypothetical protein VKF15_02625 [Nitrososphaerales archaeon]|nr:hypothetical protein [Nitrososphaerales archaeon]
MALPAIPTTLSGLLFLLVALVILWVIVSIPVYFAGKAVTGGKATFGEAMGATLGGGLAYFVVYYGVVLFLGPLFGGSTALLALILAFIVWLAVYRASFETGWLGALGIVIVGWLILLILDFFLVQLFGVSVPNFLPF